MKTLILDEAKWRCGNNADEANRRGTGGTRLLNREGYMCCLGQFSKQLNKKVTDELLLDAGKPYEIYLHIPLLLKKNGTNSDLSREAMKINDDTDTTVTEKVKALRKLFAEKGFKIIFKRKKSKP